MSNIRLSKKQQRTEANEIRLIQIFFLREICMILSFDVIVIGGGATGLGIATEAISRGYKTLVLEAQDYGTGASSKSTKLVHGGIRYLENLNFSLVEERIEERYYFLKNAPHLAHCQSYLIPFKNFREKLKYKLGIKINDLLSSKYKIGNNKFLSKTQTLRSEPDLAADKIASSVVYFDGQFDDSRILIALLKTFESCGGIAYNYHKVTDFTLENNRINGIICENQFTKEKLTFKSNIVINAAGTFSDKPTQMQDDLYGAQSCRLVFDRSILNPQHAILAPGTKGSSILFILPWHDQVIVGVTDVRASKPKIEPRTQEEEIDFILNTLNAYINKTITRKDIKTIFCGQKPVVQPIKDHSLSKTPRKHRIFQTENGLITMVGGKWTAYRRVGQDTIDYIERIYGFNKTKSVTHELQLFGYTLNKATYPLSVYGSEAENIKLIQQETGNFNLLHPNLPYFQAEVIYQVRHEQAKTIEDVLARRTRALFLNNEAALAAAPLVAKLMAKELNLDNKWQESQLDQFKSCAAKFSINA